MWYRGAWRVQLHLCMRYLRASFDVHHFLMYVMHETFHVPGVHGMPSALIGSSPIAGTFKAPLLWFAAAWCCNVADCCLLCFAWCSSFAHVKMSCVSVARVCVGGLVCRSCAVKSRTVIHACALCSSVRTTRSNAALPTPLELCLLIALAQPPRFAAMGRMPKR